MEHIYPGIIEPFGEIIENLIALPSRMGTGAKMRRRAQRDGLFPLTEKEEELRILARALAKKSAELDEKEQALTDRHDAGRIYTLPVGSILPSPYQPRRSFEDLSLFSLSESIRRHGILRPLTVRRCGETVTDNGEARYELIAGERRLRAACAVGMESVPCIVLEADNRRAAELALVENLQRENLNMFEEASAIAALIDIHAMTREEIAKSLSKSQSAVANKLRILRLTQTERDMILEHHLSERHARALLRIKTLDDRIACLTHIAAHHCTVADTEDYIDRMIAEQERKAEEANSTACEEKPAVSRETSAVRGKPVIKDLGLFYNTLDRALSLLTAAGIPASKEQREEESRTVIRILIDRGITQ